MSAADLEPRPGLDYTRAPIKARIFQEEDGTWSLDGIDETRNYTEACWNFDTYAEALAACPDFHRVHVAPAIVHAAYIPGAILDRKERGTDCTQDESAIIKRWFDQHHADASNDLFDRMATAFPVEWAEWHEERDRGAR